MAIDRCEVGVTERGNQVFIEKHLEHKYIID